MYIIVVGIRAPPKSLSETQIERMSHVLTLVVLFNCNDIEYSIMRFRIHVTSAYYVMQSFSAVFPAIKTFILALWCHMKKDWAKYDGNSV